MIKRVILFSHGMLMVFDQTGQQLSDYQGKFSEQGGKILRDAPKDAVFEIGDWKNGMVITTRECFTTFYSQVAK